MQIFNWQGHETEVSIQMIVAECKYSLQFHALKHLHSLALELAVTSRRYHWREGGLSGRCRADWECPGGRPCSRPAVPPGTGGLHQAALPLQ